MAVFSDTPADRRRRARMIRQYLVDHIDPAVREAMAHLPRQWFVPTGAGASAYDDSALAIGSQQTISQPRVVARMLSDLALQPGLAVLDVGSGSGYVAALLARILGASGQVYACERQATLVAESRAAIGAAAQADNCAPVMLRHADGALGWPEHAPFDRIHVACAANDVPAELIDQLTPGGIMVIPIGPEGEQELRVIRKDADGTVHSERSWAVRFVPLLGGVTGGRG